MAASGPFVDWRTEPGREVMAGDVVWDMTGKSLQVIRATMAPGTTFAIHRHPHEQIIVVLAGTLDFSVGDQRQLVTAGQAIHISPNVAHGGRVHGTEPVLTVEAFHPPRVDFGHSPSRPDLTNPR